jgi:phage I-like protein
MSEQGASNDAQGGGQQPEPRMFTQQELDRLIAERLERQAKKFADYDALKAKADKWVEIEEQQKSEQQRMAERLAKLQEERDIALQTSQQRLIKAAFVAEAAKAGVAHPGDVYALADLAAVSMGDDGEVRGVAEAVKAIVEAGRVPLITGKPQPGRLDGGAGAAARPSEREAPLSDEEVAYARKLGLSAEQYAKAKRERAAR